MDEVLPKAALSDFSLEAARFAIRQYIDRKFSHLILDISVLTEGTQTDKVLSGLVLVLAELFVHIEQSAIPRITKARIATYFSGGVVQGYEYGPAFVPAEICRIYRSGSEKLEAIETEVKQILPQGLHHKHRRSDSNGSTNFSHSNPLRDDRLTRSNTQRARSDLLGSHLAKLFKQKMEIFTKVEHSQV
ncbi:hypothetical protein NMG60_11032934 [Bertholletia excelsa]